MPTASLSRCVPSCPGLSWSRGTMLAELLASASRALLTGAARAALTVSAPAACRRSLPRCLALPVRRSSHHSASRGRNLHKNVIRGELEAILSCFWASPAMAVVRTSFGRKGRDGNLPVVTLILTYAYCGEARQATLTNPRGDDLIFKHSPFN